MFTEWECPALQDNPPVTSPALLGLAWSNEVSGVFLSTYPGMCLLSCVCWEAISQQVLNIVLFVVRNDIQFCVARRCIKFKGLEN